ncbi:MAG TPA: BON domain-containing protein [Myxococcota bacterium]|jgi:hyperosmotically inducible protein|nr:BON domain-containing protein [Myxococcota bacterium]
MRFILAILLAGACLQGCRTTEPIGRQVDDSVITSKIDAKFATDPNVPLVDIAVQTDEGVVTLTGRVPDAKMKTEAERIALETEGVRSVHNLIHVGAYRESAGSD